ncbi:hypothetical protein A2382_03145 [Candidatus Woesebacteria bacterium RIFOXYB1_FULL_38_16]|uniref:Uncharacterized protein n=1 Tax=Candidatus Woesebacteria bacterium RIFOXYB1_FULL_38_16 TaxID=1802538 RepID=A0A1F8CU98_9BACT|nr:MAG: hypothetical protein A2191_02295 [Candidatus Woesebacteria bacterium RIFOXYA1_FULL_38_9]OGM79897.1 MAG: hypothetical protein A2382_03145 [Candidatus Woesebacteria bacterium RIFOXYB1_FULL_38_16]
MKVKKIQDLFPNTAVARYNLAAWQKKGGDSIYFIGREVTKPGHHGEPDTGILKLFELDNNGEILQERTIWKPSHNGISLEDPRALEVENDELVIGLTAVLRNKRGKPIPFPAIVKIGSYDSWNKKLPPFLVIETFGAGKNVTPIDSFTYMFRPEKREYFYKILVFSLHKQVPKKLSNIVFPTNLPWANWRVGTTMSPIWINEKEALFIVHGITIQNINGVDKYVYSLGRAKLTRKGNKFEVIVSKEPILTPDDFLNEDGSQIVQDLHPELRRVVYSCGGIIKKGEEDRLSLYVNVGDRATFEVQYSIEELKEGLFN